MFCNNTAKTANICKEKPFGAFFIGGAILKNDYIYIKIIILGMKFRETKDIEVFSELINKPLQIWILAEDRVDKNTAVCIFRKLEAMKRKILDMLADCPFYAETSEEDKNPENLFEVDIDTTSYTVDITPKTLFGAVVARLVQFWAQENVLRKGCSKAADFISAHYIKESAKKIILEPETEEKDE